MRKNADQALSSGMEIVARMFVVALVAWVSASVVLAFPHGSGHSVESLTAFEVLREASFALWVGGLAYIGATAAVRAWRSLEKT
jgi:hypothetical protein